MSKYFKARPFTLLPNSTLLPKLILSTSLAGMLTLTGCQTVSGLFGSDEEAVATASKSDAEYYREAVTALDKGQYLNATTQLTELRTFYPTGQYAEQALLDLMYAQFQSKEYETAAASAEQFIKLYPNNPQADYAYYVRGVANMQAGQNALVSLAGLDQAHRDTGYMRLAFEQLQALVTRYPNSVYTPDAAQRMSYIYNQFAEHELAAARWYIKRDAYLAAANRAKWVFQYYPLSEQVPEAIAILAYSHDQLGMTDLANEYKTLLQINYPDWMRNDGTVRLADGKGFGRTLLNTVTLGRLGRSDESSTTQTVSGNYAGQTKTQVIQRAQSLQLPQNDTATTNSNLPNLTQSGNGIRFGLGLPESDTGQASSNNSASQTAQNSANASMTTAVPPSRTVTVNPTAPIPEPITEEADDEGVDSE